VTRCDAQGMQRNSHARIRELAHQAAGCATSAESAVSLRYPLAFRAFQQEPGTKPPFLLRLKRGLGIPNEPDALVAQFRIELLRSAAELQVKC
jgi:hypothetical protein